LGKSRPIFAGSIRRSRTREKVCVTRANRFGAKKARRSSSMTIIRKTVRDRIHKRIRKKVTGTADRPRLCVHFSGKHIYAQVVDDDSGKTLIAAASTQKDVLGKNKSASNRATAEMIGKAIAERARAKKIDNVVFDRGGFIYHGKVKALADAAREGGLKF